MADPRPSSLTKGIDLEANLGTRTLVRESYMSFSVLVRPCSGHRNGSDPWSSQQRGVYPLHCVIIGVQVPWHDTEKSALRVLMRVRAMSSRALPMLRQSAVHAQSAPQADVQRDTGDELVMRQPATHA